MAYETITVTQVTPAIGGEVSGLDLTKPLPEAQVAELKAAMADRLVLFFRDQPLSHEDHIRLAQYFGGVHIAPSTKPWQVPGHPEVTIIHADENSTFVAGEDWHSDMSCDEAPPMGSILYLHTIPPVGGDTVFSNMYAAYDALSDRMKAYLEGLTAVHDAVVGFGGITPEGMKLRLDIAARISSRIAASIDPRDLVDVAMGDAASSETRQAVARAETREQALALLLMSPEFQRR